MFRFVVVCLLALGLCAACSDDSSSSDMDRMPPPTGDGDGDGTSGMGGDGDGDMGDDMMDGSPFGTDPTRNDVTPGAICARLAVIQCAGEQVCCDTPSADQASCEADAESACTTGLGLDAVAGDAAVGFDAAAAAAAITMYENRAMQCDPSAPAWALSPDGFTGAFTGTLGPGEDCMPEGGLEADLPVIFAALASCTNVATQACLPTETTWTCEPRGGADAACFTDLNCQDGLFCDPALTTMGTCKARKAAGEACLTANECSSAVCKDSVCGADDDVQAAYCL
ncbi:MAG: hypothetical protein OXT09_23525 [Myxococcales bacterium]|nr:hypothetical protein [Myxococcales bacterium]